MATRDKLIEEIENYIPLKDSLPSDVQFPCVNILLFGSIGSGKSATYNTMNSVFRGKIFNTAASGGFENVITRKVCEVIGWSLIGHSKERSNLRKNVRTNES